MLGGTLLDDRSTPPLRDVIGTLLSCARRADFAIGNVRLAAIDLSDLELARLEHCRLLLDRLDVNMLADAATVRGTDGRAARSLDVLNTFAHSGRLEIRAAGRTCWSPDFSVFHGLPVSAVAVEGAACLVGAHYFSQPVARDGVSLTCALTGSAAVRDAASHFESLWCRAHDVLPVVRDLLGELVRPPATRRRRAWTR
jgi:hypothetical protein